MSVHAKALTLPAHEVTSESPRIRLSLEQAKKQVGFIPNMYARMVKLSRSAGDVSLRLRSLP